MLLPDLPKQFVGMNLKRQVEVFEEAGFSMIMKNEAYQRMRFYDIKALVWFAKVIPWEFVGFSVDKCFDKLYNITKIIQTEGYVQGRAHRYLIVARKN